MTLSEELAGFAAALRYEDLPASVVERVRLHALDIVGVCLAGAQLEFAAILKRLASNEKNPESTLLGSGGMRASASAATLYNGGLAHGNEFDDTYAPGRWHGSAPTVPPALAVAEAQHADGKTLITALAAGLEAGCRLTRAAPALLSRGFHSTCTAGVFSAALAVGRLLGLDRERLANALGVAGSFAAGTMEFLSDPEPWSKRIQVGYAGQGAILAARAAAAGFKGPRTILEGRHGYFRSYAGDGNFDLSRVTEAIGSDWQLLKLYPKRYPCDHIAQGYVDCAIALSHELSVQDIETVTCVVHPLARAIMFEPHEVRYRPATGWSARWSMPFNMAVALADRALTLDSYTDARALDPGTRALMERVGYEENATMAFPGDYPAWLRIRSKNGRTLEEQMPKVAGSAENPVAPVEYEAKFLDNARRALGMEKARTALELLRNLPAARDVAPLVQACG
ncbi:MAG: MmgE/PrpD family protein [Betaproteobacteria bacterium]|nr:MAG: MmgE/PrpD family protein [Betaproteobacteria bacterium]